MNKQQMNHMHIMNTLWQNNIKIYISMHKTGKLGKELEIN
jgi:hypothetical protein